MYKPDVHYEKNRSVPEFVVFGPYEWDAGDGAKRLEVIALGLQSRVRK